MRKVILGKNSGDIFSQAVVYTLFHRLGDFTRNLSRNLPFYSVSLSMPLPFTFSLSILLPYTSLSLSLLHSLSHFTFLMREQQRKGVKRESTINIVITV